MAEIEIPYLIPCSHCTRLCEIITDPNKSAFECKYCGHLTMLPQPKKWLLSQGYALLEYPIIEKTFALVHTGLWESQAIEIPEDGTAITLPQGSRVDYIKTTVLSILL